MPLRSPGAPNPRPGDLMAHPKPPGAEEPSEDQAETSSDGGEPAGDADAALGKIRPPELVVDVP